jgi:hypothetical protein
MDREQIEAGDQRQKARRYQQSNHSTEIGTHRAVTRAEHNSHSLYNRVFVNLEAY